MRIRSIFKTYVFTSVICCLGLLCSCEKGPETEPELSYGNIEGIVKDNENNLLDAVTVSIKGIEETVLSDADGKFVFNNVPVKSQLVTFTKEGYNTVGMTVQTSSFKDGVVVINPVLQIANATIKGTVLDVRSGGKPFEGVRVSAGSSTAVTDAEGKYIIERLAPGDYDVNFSAEGVKTVSVSISRPMFDNDEITVTLDPVYLGGQELLRGLSAQELKYADKWYYNEYRGGKKNGGKQLDWSVVYLSTLKFVGQWVNQNEGCTLQIRNNESDRSNPADLENFDSFLYGKKKITEDNKILTMYCRTHNAETNSVRWGVRVIDISDMINPKSELVGGVREFSSTVNRNIAIDLSAYVGKEVIIAIGNFRAETGDWYNQFVIRKMSFGPEANNGDNFLPGTEISGLDGWHMTHEMVRSTMTNSLTSFTGIPSIAVEPKGAKGYNPWNGTNHMAAQWALMYVNKDVEPTNGDGFAIKVRGAAPADLNKPESYFYAKFNIDGSHDRMTFRTRNGDNEKYTYFKITVIEENGNVTHLDPISHKAVKAEKAESGCWKFINNAGNVTNVEEYATFDYDLSSFAGKDVVMTIGIFKGETTNGEQKLFFHSIDFE